MPTNVRNSTSIIQASLKGGAYSGVQLPPDEREVKLPAANSLSELGKGLNLRNYNLSESKYTAIIEAASKLVNSASSNSNKPEASLILNEEVRQFIQQRPDMACHFIDPESLECLGANECRLIHDKRRLLKKQCELLKDPCLKEKEQQRIRKDIKENQLSINKLLQTLDKIQLDKLRKLQNLIQQEALAQNRQELEKLSERKISSSTPSFGADILCRAHAEKKEQRKQLELELDRIAAKERAKQAAINAAIHIAKSRFNQEGMKPSSQAIETMARDLAGIGPLENAIPFSHHYISFDLASYLARESKQAPDNSNAMTAKPKILGKL